MSHSNAALTPVARLKVVEACQHRPKAHVAAEFMISRATVTKWCRRYAEHGTAGLQETSCRPHASPTQTPPEVVARIEALRRDHKWSATRIAFELGCDGIRISARTVGRWFGRLGINRRRHLLPDGENSRKTSRKITARYPGHMVHLDVKKTGRIRRRRRLVRPRPEQRASPRCRACQDQEGRQTRVRVPAQRAGSHHDRVLPPG